MTLVRYCRQHMEADGTFDSRPGSPSYRDLRILEEDLNYQPGFGYERDLTSRVAPTYRTLGGKIVTGTMRSFFRPDEAGELFLSLFGKVTTTVPSGSVRLHTYVIQDDPSKNLRSLGLDFGLEKIREVRISGAAATRLEMIIDGAGEIMMNWDIIAANEITATFGSHSPTYSTLSPLTGADKATCTLNSVAQNPESIRIVFERNYNQDARQHGSRKLQELEWGPFNTTVELTQRFTTDTELNEFLAETERDFVLQYSGATITGAYKYHFKLDLDNISYDQGLSHINRQERALQTIAFTATHPTTSDTTTVELQNTEAQPATYGT